MAADHLLDLRRVAVATDVVGRHALVALWEVRHQLGLPPRAADPALGIDDDVVGLEQAAPDERRQRKDGRGRIAAGIGHEPLSPDRLAKQLRQAVGGVAEPLRIGMHMAIPFQVSRRVVEPVVGAEIDDSGAGRQHLRQDLGAGAVRQAAEHAVGPPAHLLRREILQRQVEATHEARMHARDRRAALLAAGDGDNLGLRVPQQQFDGFERRVAGGAENRDGDHDKLRGQGMRFYRGAAGPVATPSAACRSAAPARPPRPASCQPWSPPPRASGRTR